MSAGLAAEFDSEDALRDAVDAMVARGYVELDACTPFPVEHLERKLGLGRRSALDWAVFPVALGAAGGGFFLQWFCNGYDYPINVGGRPPLSWPAFIPITFESGVLGTAIVAVILFCVIARLPAVTHPLFGIAGFERASIDRFWLVVNARDARFDLERTAGELAGTGALQVAPFGSASGVGL